MFFPWIGLFEQIRLADVFVYLDDVDLNRRAFQNRVQYKTAGGVRWLTVPLAGATRGQQIRDAAIDNGQGWRGRHLDALAQAYASAPYRGRMLRLVAKVYAEPLDRFEALAVRSMEALGEELEIMAGREFLRSSALGIAGKGSARILEIVRTLGGDHYVTGWGARNYLDHEEFARKGVRVSYMAYECRPYAQFHGEFDPHVSALDAVAHCGKAAARLVCSGTVDWQEFMRESR